MLYAIQLKLTSQSVSIHSGPNSGVGRCLVTSLIFFNYDEDIHQSLTKKSISKHGQFSPMLKLGLYPGIGYVYTQGVGSLGTGLYSKVSPSGHNG